jgi:hypothetical protein
MGLAPRPLAQQTADKRATVGRDLRRPSRVSRDRASAGATGHDPRTIDGERSRDSPSRRDRNATNSLVSARWAGRSLGARSARPHWRHSHDRRAAEGGASGELSARLDSSQCSRQRRADRNDESASPRWLNSIESGTFVILVGRGRECPYFVDSHPRAARCATARCRWAATCCAIAPACSSCAEAARDLAPAGSAARDAIASAMGSLGGSAQRCSIFATAVAKDPLLSPQEESPHENGTISKSRSLARPISAW